MKRLHLLVPISLFIVLAGCPGKKSQTASVPQPTLPAAKTDTDPAQDEVVAAAYKRDASNPFQAEAYAEPEFKAEVADYKVEPNFANVGNWAKFSPLLNAEQKDMLAKNL